MSKVTVSSPNPDYSGVTAGIEFASGKGEFDPSRQHAAARYFDRHGYTYKGAPKPVDDEQETDPATLGQSDDGAPDAAPDDAEQRDAALGADPGDGVAATAETAADVKPETGDGTTPAKGKAASK